MMLIILFIQLRQSQVSGKILCEDLPVVKELDLARILMPLSCADLRWNELISTNAILNGKDLDNQSINTMDLFECFTYTKLNLVLFAHHFQYQAKITFKNCFIDRPLGKVKDHAIRVEFHIRENLHIHSFL